MSRTELSSLGEFGLIRHLTEHFPVQQKSTILGVGDDAAAIEVPAGMIAVLTTDMLIEGVHFDLSYVPLRHLGYKAVVVNLSDVYAMNAVPAQITVSIAVSNRFSLEAMEELYAGMLAACEHYGVDLVGGDTSTSVSGLAISVSAVGFVEKARMSTRRNARKGDLLCVTGDLGGAYLGLQVLEREKKVFLESPGVQPELSGFEYVIGRQLKPEARRDLVQFFSEQQIVPTSMIDISDGLASEILHLERNSGHGMVIYEEKIPIAADTGRVAEQFSLAPVTCALSGGEDYELLFTVGQSDYEKISANPSVSIIGYVDEPESSSRMVTRAGATIAITAQGWNAFS
ncbi:MAG: hypothetical protein RL220_489 [Bacteroidota bacterium]